MATDILNETAKPKVVADQASGAADDFQISLGPTFVKLLKPLASLKLTVTLLAMSIFIVLAGTMAQVDKDIWEVVDKYFRCAIAWIDLQIFFPPSFFPSKPNIPDWLVVPFPGGWLIGAMMFLNLMAAHGLRFKPQASGIRLSGGIGVIALGMLTTWLVVESGSSPDGLQHASWISWESLWTLFKLGLTAAWGGSVYAVFQQFRSEPAEKFDVNGREAGTKVDKVKLGLWFVAAATLTVTTLWLWTKGDAARLDDSSMRILWQLLKGTFAGLVLLAGCLIVFKKRAGVVLLHGGIGLMMVSELVVGISAVEGQISLLEGERTNFARDIRSFELAIVDSSAAETETHVVIPKSQLLRSNEGGKIQHGLLPFDVQVVEFLPNADVRRLQDGDKNSATDGLGKVWLAEEMRASAGTDSDSKVDYPAAYVRLTKRGSDEAIGTHLASVLLSEENRFDQVAIDGKTYDLSLRFKRDYKPYTVELIDVRKDDYIGTDTPRYYSSDIHVADASRGTDFRFHVWMNNPLRYAGETIYQSGYHKVPTTGVEGTSLQVVTNAGWMIPYIACMIVAVGMLTHFTITLLRFLDRRSRESAPVLSVAAGSSVPSDQATWHGYSSASGNGMSKKAQKKAKLPPTSVTATEPADWQRWLPLGAVVVLSLYVGSKARPPEIGPDGFDYAAFGKLPIVADGRVKPIDTYARTTLRIIAGTETFKDDNDKTQPAIRWLLDTIARPDDAKKHKVLRIENLEVQQALGIKPRKGYRYAPNELDQTKLAELGEAIEKARAKGPKGMSVSERKSQEFERKFGMYDTLTRFSRVREADTEMPQLSVLSAYDFREELKTRKMPLVVPPLQVDDVTEGKDNWQPYALAAFLEPIEANPEHRDWSANIIKLLDRLKDSGRVEPVRLKWAQGAKEWLSAQFGVSVPAATKANPAITAWREMLSAYEKGDAKTFNSEVAKYHATLKGRSLKEVSLSKVGYEWFFNQFQPFFLSSMSYFFVFLAATLAWLGWTKTLNRTAFWMTCFTLALHTFALVSRIYISGRPPVTNLYSTAVFIGWGTVVLGLVLEAVYRLGIGNVVSAMTGFTTLLIAHYLAGDGDTFIVLQAVLDTQFWLATHVTTINLGYATTFLAGMLGVLYVLRGVFTRSLTPDVEKNLGRMIYGTLCFGIFFSFVGTVLGGLWADDSWGRFWGWDPKENGALMIVLWNALVLHARWGGMVKDRGTAVLVIGGNIVTSWSWFGVNELGVGLHSYGFTEGVLLALGIFVLSQLAVIGLGCLPKESWASFRDHRLRAS